jgi:hypothetical protein
MKNGDGRMKATICAFDRMKREIKLYFPLFLTIACGGCLWLSWTTTASARSSLETTSRSMAMTTARIPHHDIPIDPHMTLEYTNLESVLEKMTSLTRNSEAFCNHSVLPRVDWVVAATTPTMRWTVPLQHVIYDPNKLLVGDLSERITFQLCRRDCCVAGGECLDIKFVLLPTTAITTINSITTIIPTCQTFLEIQQSLQNGAWKQSTTNKKGESWFSNECTLPTDFTLFNTIKRQRVLFIGDSTMQELALMIARAAGSAKPNALLLGNANENLLNCTCKDAIQVGTTKDCRTFDASSSSSSLNVSMQWSGHAECNGNRKGIHVVDNDEWKRTVSHKVQAMQPHILFFQVPLSHSCTDISEECIQTLKRYICFMTLFENVKPVLIISGAAIGRLQSQGPTGRHCPAHLRNWVDIIYTTMKQVAPHVDILDIFTPTERYVNVVSSSNRDPFRPACKSMERHLTCNFLDVDFKIAIDSPFYILPPGRLAGAAILQFLRAYQDEAGES